MKAIKFFSVALAMAFAMNANAQFATGGKKSAGSSTMSFEPESHVTVDLKVGSVAGRGGFGVGIGYQKSFYGGNWGTLAWDVFNLDWNAPFKSPTDLDYLSLKTGLRYFTPSFANDKLRVYTNIAMGYTCVLSKGGLWGVLGLNDNVWDNWKDYDRDYRDYLEELEDYFDDYDDDYLETIQASHGFGLTWGFGVQINKKFSVGYSLQYETAFKTKSHLATIGFSF